MLISPAPEDISHGLMAVPCHRLITDTCKVLPIADWKNLTVGYTLPVKWLSKIHVQKARLYFSGENLLTLDRLDTDYIDPEAAAAGTNWKTGKTNALSYPFSKTYSLVLILHSDNN